MFEAFTAALHRVPPAATTSTTSTTAAVAVTAPPTALALANACVATSGLCTLVTRPPSPLLSAVQIESVLVRLTQLLLYSSSSAEEQPQQQQVSGTVFEADSAARAALDAVKAVGQRRAEYAQLVLQVRFSNGVTIDSPTCSTAAHQAFFVIIITCRSVGAHCKRHR
jgi:hypothetical protein